MSARLEPNTVALGTGSRVRVRSGPFADKVGVVAELDGRGAARVIIGGLSTRVELADIEPLAARSEKRALQSSHRRPSATSLRRSR